MTEQPEEDQVVILVNRRLTPEQRIEMGAAVAKVLGADSATVESRIVRERPDQARAFDLPGWQCPPRVRDILGHEHSWGLIRTSDVAQDELGYLWANGDTVPRYGHYSETDANPGAIVAWTDQGIGLHVHAKSLRYLPSISRLDMEPDKWLPVAAVLPELPEWVNAR